VRYTIVVNAEVNSREDVVAHRDAIANAIATNPDFVPDTAAGTTGETTAAASSLVPLFFFALVALFVVIF
jgi:hypothetical protein